MENPSYVEGAVSLHLYVPPYTDCQTFDQRTGVKSKATVTFHTKYGKKVDYRGSKNGNLVPGPIKEEPKMAVSRTSAAGESSKTLVKKG